jgi:hypothetical protein
MYDANPILSALINSLPINFTTYSSGKKDGVALFVVRSDGKIPEKQSSLYKLTTNGNWGLAKG